MLGHDFVKETKCGCTQKCCDVGCAVFTTGFLLSLAAVVSPVCFATQMGTKGVIGSCLGGLAGGTTSACGYMYIAKSTSCYPSSLETRIQAMINEAGGINHPVLASHIKELEPHLNNSHFEKMNTAQLAAFSQNSHIEPPVPREMV